MLIECGGLDPVAGDVVLDHIQAAGDAIAIVGESADNRFREMKLALLELLLANGIAILSARADGSGDEGDMEELHCYVESSPEQREECDIPDGVEDMVQELLEAYEVNFNGDGGFWELTITTETRECAVEIGWYYTTSGSNTETETL